MQAGREGSLSEVEEPNRMNECGSHKPSGDTAAHLLTVALHSQLKGPEVGLKLAAFTRGL